MASKGGDMTENGGKVDPMENESVRVIPVIEEHIVVGEKNIETGKIQVVKTVTEEPCELTLSTSYQDIEVERIPKNEYFDQPPQTRTEGDTTIIPVLKEVMVWQKKILLVEEIRITKKTIVAEEKTVVHLHKETVEIKNIAVNEHNKQNEI